jgi:hypothetical protein
MKNQSFTFLLILQLLIFSFTSSPLFAQEWSEPINITNLGGYSMDPDMVIDHKGVIHVVWTYKVSTGFWVIMYAKSEDDGLTWTEPLDLLQNTALVMLQPHIACDSKNNLHITYTHDNNGISPEGRLIKMITWNGHQWSEPIIVSEGMPGSNYSSIIIDQNDNPCVFWLIGAQMGVIDMYYRYYKQEIWSDIFCPFCDSTYAYLPLNPSIENEVVHWAGEQQTNVEMPVYFKFTTNLNTWEKPEMINKDTIIVDIDIALNKSNSPEIAYRKLENNPAYGSDATMHTKKEGNSWLPPDMVSGTDKRQVGQQIAIDQNNDVNVVEIEYYNSSNSDGQLVHFYKYKDKWIGQAIDSATHMINFPKLIFSRNHLYLVYYKGEEVNNGDIWFSEYDIITRLNEETQPSPELIIYPNPARSDIYIEFENNKEQHNDLSVYDFTGKHIITLINKNLPQGRQQLLWNSADKNGKEVNSGSYVVRLKSGRNIVTTTVEIVSKF